MADFRMLGEHVYAGMVLPAVVTNANIERLKELEAVEGDILIASYPKTGTTVMEMLAWLIQSDGDFELADNIPLYKRTFYMDLDVNGIKAIDQLPTAPRPVIMKTHITGPIFTKPIEQGRLKVIVINRNPKDTLASYYNFYHVNKFLGNFTGNWGDFFHLYQSKHLAYGDYFHWYSSWLPFLDKPNVELYKFEDIVKRRPSVVSQLSKFLGKTLSDSLMKKIVEHTSFSSMKSNRMANYEDFPMFDTSISPFMRKGQVGDWKNYFTEEQSAIVDKAYEDFVKQGGPLMEFE